MVIRGIWFFRWFSSKKIKRNEKYESSVVFKIQFFSSKLKNIGKISDIFRKKEPKNCFHQNHAWASKIKSYKVQKPCKNFKIIF